MEVHNRACLCTAERHFIGPPRFSAPAHTNTRPMVQPVQYSVLSLLRYWLRPMEWIEMGRTRKAAIAQSFGLPEWTRSQHSSFEIPAETFLYRSILHLTTKERIVTNQNPPASLVQHCHMPSPTACPRRCILLYRVPGRMKVLDTIRSKHQSDGRGGGGICS